MKEWWRLAFGIVIGFLGAGLILLLSRPPRGQPIALLPPPTPAPLVVDVAGAVSNPGVYNLPPGSRLQDAIQAAGGLLPAADGQAINLAAVLQDGGKVLVPFQRPTPVPGIPLTLENPPSRNETVPEATAAPVVDAAHPLNLNNATLAELDLLPGIGPVTAQKILDYRSTNGPFTTIEDLMKVSGIGQKTFDKLKGLITVGY